MNQWSMEELEKLYQEANKKAIADEAFCKELLSDTRAALEKLAGRALPDDLKLDIIAQDKSYSAAYSAPDFVQGELNYSELSPEQLDNVNGGISFVLIFTICLGAVSVGDCGGDACAVAACSANACGGAACATAACTGDGCFANACAANMGGGGACRRNACSADMCNYNTCSHDTCGRNLSAN